MTTTTLETVHLGNAAALVDRLRKALTTRTFTLSVDEQDRGDTELAGCEAEDGVVTVCFTCEKDGKSTEHRLQAHIAPSADTVVHRGTSQVVIAFRQDGITLHYLAVTGAGQYEDSVFEITFTD